MKSPKPTFSPTSITATTNAVSTLLSDYIAQSEANAKAVLQQEEPKIIAEKLALKKLIESGFSSQENIVDFVATYLTHTNHLKNPRYMGHQVAVPQELSGIPDFIHGTINNPGSLYEMGPAPATLEGFMINWMLAKVGWLEDDKLYDFEFTPHRANGVLTHGGSIANLTALTAARAAIAPEAWTEGNPDDLVVLGPANTHYSIGRALSLMGLGKNAFIPVAVDAHEVMDVASLAAVYQQVKSKGKRVMAVVANACATSTGLFDPIEAIADFCQQQQLWFHVDGAHGAVVLMSDKQRFKMKGVEKADSLIWDAHKMMRVPSLCTAVLFKNGAHLLQNFQQKGSYVFHDSKVIGMDTMPYTIECTKSALGTKLFWALALEGENKLTHYVETRFEQALYFYEMLSATDDFHCLYRPQTNILCFQYRPDQLNDAQQLELRYALVNHGAFYLTSCEIDGKRYLRVVVMNPHTQASDFVTLIAVIREKAQDLFDL